MSRVGSQNPRGERAARPLAISGNKRLHYMRIRVSIRGANVSENQISESLA